MSQRAYAFSWKLIVGLTEHTASQILQTNCSCFCLHKNNPYKIIESNSEVSSISFHDVCIKPLQNMNSVQVYKSQTYRINLLGRRKNLISLQCIVQLFLFDSTFFFLYEAIFKLTRLQQFVYMNINSVPNQNAHRSTFDSNRKR